MFEALYEKCPKCGIKRSHCPCPYPWPPVKKPASSLRKRKKAVKGKFEIQGECNHSPYLWGTADSYAAAVAIARAATDDTGDGPQWGDPNQGVTAHILWVGDGRRLKLAVVSSVDTAKVDLADGFVGDFCVVPEEYPDEVFLFVWSHRYEARPSSRDERFFLTHPEPTPDEAWQDFLGVG